MVNGDSSLDLHVVQEVRHRILPAATEEVQSLRIALRQRLDALKNLENAFEHRLKHPKTPQKPMKTHENH